MKKSVINMKFKLKGAKPSLSSFGGNEIGKSDMDDISDMEVCAELVRRSSRAAGMEWIMLDVVEADGFYYRLRTTITDGQATTEFGVPEACVKSDKVKERVAQFKEIFESNGGHIATLH